MATIPPTTMAKKHDDNQQMSPKMKKKNGGMIFEKQNITKRLSRVALFLAKQSERLGLHDDAARLLDLSGDDDRLTRYINGRIQNTKEDSTAAAERLKELGSAIEATGGVVPGGEGEYKNVFRRSSLLPGAVRFPQVTENSCFLSGNSRGRVENNTIQKREANAVDVFVFGRVYYFWAI